MQKTANLFGYNEVVQSNQITLTANNNVNPITGIGLIRYYNGEIQISNNGAAFTSVPTSTVANITAGTNIELTPLPSTTVVAVSDNPSFANTTAFSSTITGLTANIFPYIDATKKMANTTMQYNSGLGYVGIGVSPTFPLEVTGQAKFNTGLIAAFGAGNLLPAIQVQNDFAATSSNYAAVLDILSPNVATGSGTDVRIGRSTSLGALIRYNYTSATNTANSLLLGIIGGTYPALTINGTGTITTAGAVNGRNMTTDGTNLDTVVSRVNQSVTTTSSPSFTNVTVTGQFNGPRVEIKNSLAAASVVINNPVASGVIRFAATGTEFIAMGSDSIYLSNIRAYVTTITLRNNMACDPGVLIDGRDVSVDGSNLDTVVSRVNQALNTTSSPTFVGLTVNGNITVTGTVDGRDISVDGSTLDTLNGRVNQAVNTTSSPTFVGLTVNGNITVTGTVDGRDISVDGTNLDTVVSRVNQAVNTTSSPSFAGLTVTSTTSATALNVLNSSAIAAAATALLEETYATNAAVTARILQRIGRSNTQYASTSYLYGNITPGNAANRYEIGFASNPRFFSIDATGRTHVGTQDLPAPGLFNIYGSQSTTRVNISGTDGTNGTWRIACPTTALTVLGVNAGETLGFGTFISDNSAYTLYGQVNSTAFKTTNHVIQGSGSAETGGLRMNGTQMQYYNGTAWTTLFDANLYVPYRTYSGLLRISRLELGGGSWGVTYSFSGPILGLSPSLNSSFGSDTGFVMNIVAGTNYYFTFVVGNVNYGSTAIMTIGTNTQSGTFVITNMYLDNTIVDFTTLFAGAAGRYFEMNVIATRVTF